MGAAASSAAACSPFQPDATAIATWPADTLEVPSIHATAYHFDQTSYSPLLSADAVTDGSGFELTPSPSYLDDSTASHPSTGHQSPTSSTSSSGAGGHLQPGLSLPKKRGRPPASPSLDDEDTVVKRQRNNAAAKKYRQKKIDRIQELEEEVDDVKRERDDLRIKLARQEAETAALREMLKMATSDGMGMAMARGGKQ
ncbi:hypothetical protein B0H63DRAFT_513983 [Podospora didyma]|uniref:BZIP domain-containing protein n=1 Tax=Podospora didyma TaxID=330526 RepID=A0AAE0KAF2_9PEZI|nr:hypothetical protein B0H63DRAFT_513983 [Podospora didyma]